MLGTSDAINAWLKRRRDQAYQEGFEIGIEEAFEKVREKRVHAKWEAWLSRMQEAQAQGLPFHEPPPYFKAKHGSSPDPKLLKRITLRRHLFGGKPTIRNLRVRVELVLSLLAQGVPPEEIMEDYPDLEMDDIHACVAYAHAVISRNTLKFKKLISD